MTDAGPPTPPPTPPPTSPPSLPPSVPPSLPTGWSSSPTGPPPSTPVEHPTASTIAPAAAPRRRWLVVLIGVLALVVSIGVSGTVLFATNTLPPLRTAYHFTNDLADGDVDGAYGNLCAALKGPGGRDELGTFASEIRRGLVKITVNPLGVDRNGDRATVDFTAFHRGDRHTNLALVVVNEDGDWRVCDVRFRS